MRKIHSQKPFTFFLEFLLALVFFMISATILLQVYAGSMRLHQQDEDRRKAMLFAQNLIESDQDLSTYTQSFDQEFQNEGDYFQAQMIYKESPYPHYVLEIRHDQAVLVEYEWVLS